MSKTRIGILTGGGDVPGLNSVIKSVVYRGAEIGCSVIGIRFCPPGSDTGGTFLYSSRTNPPKMKELPYQSGFAFFQCVHQGTIHTAP